MGWTRSEKPMCIASAAPPPPASPLKGDVSLHSGGAIGPHAQSDTAPLMRKAGRGWGHTLGVAVLALASLATPALAQALPYHVDPSAREVPPSLTAVPAI